MGAEASRRDGAGEGSLRYRGWRIVAALFLIQVAIFGFGLYGQGIYVAELRRLHGWPTGVISTGSTLSLVLSSLFAIFVSDLIRWAGPRRMMVAGIVALAASLVLLATADTLAQLYAGFTMLALAWVGLGTVSAATIVSAWFDRKRGQAVSITFMGASVSGVVLMPGLVALVEAIGFRHAFEIAALAVLLMLPVAATIRFPHAQDASGAGAMQGSAPSRRALLCDAGFLYLTGAFALAIMVQVGFIVHQISILQPVIGLQSAGGAVALTTAMALAGRVGLGIVADRINPRQVAVLAIGSQAAALLAIGFAGRTEVVVVACAVFGFSIGNLITLPALIIQREFAPAAFSIALGLSMAIAGVINAFGPAAMGLLRDLTGGYAAPIVVGVIIQVGAAVAVGLAPRTMLTLSPAE